MNNHPSSSSNNTASEVDLVDLARILWQQKLLILSSMLAFAVAATLYAQFSRSIYIAKINLQPAAPSEIAKLNYFGLKQFNPDEIYAIFTHELESDRIYSSLYQDIYLTSITEKTSTTYASAAELSSHISTTGTAPGRLTIAMRDSSPDKLKMLLEGLLLKASDSAKEKVLNNLAFEIKTAIQRHDHEINAEREISKAKRSDLITRLQEALRIAESLHIEKVSTFIEANKNEELAYLRGTHALKAEIASLQNRTNDDPYIGKIRESFFQKNFLSTIAVQPADFAVFSPEEPIELLGPIKPKQSMIIGIGVIFGGFLGVIIALARCFARKKE